MSKESASILCTPSSASSASRVIQKKRELSSPEFSSDIKKNKVYLSPNTSMSQQSESDISGLEAEIETTMDTQSIGAWSQADREQLSSSQQPNVNITFSDSDMAKISVLLKESFRGEARQEAQEEQKNMIQSIVDGVVKGLTEKIISLETENRSLKSRIEKLEANAEAAEQYSRRNCLRVSGVQENSDEDTDEIILNMSRAMKIDLNINDIDRSHRIGKPSTVKPRDIIVKWSTYRARQKIYLARSHLKDVGYYGTFINEDLTKYRSGLLFSARTLVKQRRLTGAWSSNGTVLVKTNNGEVRRIHKDDDLTDYRTAPPRQPPRPVQGSSGTT